MDESLEGESESVPLLSGRTPPMKRIATTAPDRTNAKPAAYCIITTT
jgi:hypothetical protein